jgi:hypothetical protein
LSGHFPPSKSTFRTSVELGWRFIRASSLNHPPIRLEVTAPRALRPSSRHCLHPSLLLAYDCYLLGFVPCRHHWRSVGFKGSSFPGVAALQADKDQSPGLSLASTDHEAHRTFRTKLQDESPVLSSARDLWPMDAARAYCAQFTVGKEFLKSLGSFIFDEQLNHRLLPPSR